MNPDLQQTLASHGWWVASRASGIVALLLVTVSVILGLMMAGKIARRPGLGRKLAAIHEQTALAGLIAIGIHGVTLLGDPWLNPGVSGLAIPFEMSYRPIFTGLGVIAGYGAALLGLSFYARRRIGAKLWRKAHRATVLVYVLGVVHALGAGTDASVPWLRWAILGSTVPVGVLFAVRLTASRRTARRRLRTRDVGAPGLRGDTRPRRFLEPAHRVPVVIGEEA